MNSGGKDLTALAVPVNMTLNTASTSTLPAAAAGTITIGGDLVVNRLGYGAMQLPGAGVWGETRDRDGALAVLRRSIELGVNLIDTADSYGPYISDELIRAALHPYTDDLVIATKVGLTRQGPGVWTPVGRPAYLRQQVELNLRNLGLERIDLLQLHRVDPAISIEEQVGELVALQAEGKIRHIGLSEVTVDQVKAAQKVATIASVQNMFNLTNRSSSELLDYSEANGIAFIPWFPLATGALAGEGSPLAALAATHGTSPSQLALAWLLRRSPALLPIPGTASVAHLEDNVAAASIVLTDAEFAALDAIV
jgi:pyridoxine 4-dehydrogenase